MKAKAVKEAAKEFKISEALQDRIVASKGQSLIDFDRQFKGT